MVFANGLLYLYLANVQSRPTSDISTRSVPTSSDFQVESNPAVTVDENQALSIRSLLDVSIGKMVLDELSANLGSDYIADSWAHIKKMGSILQTVCLNKSSKPLAFRAGSSCSRLNLVRDVMVRAVRSDPSFPPWPLTIFPTEIWECGTPLGLIDETALLGLANSCLHTGRVYSCVPEEDIPIELGCLTDTAGRIMAASSCPTASVLCGEMPVGMLALAANAAHIKAQPSPIQDSIDHLRAVRLPPASVLPPRCPAPPS